MINDVTLASAPAPIGVHRASFSIPNPSEPAKPLDKRFSFHKYMHAVSHLRIMSSIRKSPPTHSVLLSSCQSLLQPTSLPEASVSTSTGPSSAVPSALTILW